MSEVYSDHDFVSADAGCLICGEPAPRTENDTIYHPVFASGERDENGEFIDKQAATVCSKCVSQEAVEQCIQEARTRADNPEQIGHIFQVLGTPEQQEAITDIIHHLDPEPEP